MKQQKLLTLVILFAFYANGWAQKVTCTGGTGDKTLKLNELSVSCIAKGQYTSITLTDEWNQTAINKLIAAIHQYNENTTLLTAYMGDITLHADVKSLNCIFMNCKALKEVILPNIGSNNNLSLSSAFEKCKVLTTINNLDKFTNIKDFSYIFTECPALKEVNLPNAENKNSISFYGAFASCSALTTVNNLDKFTNVEDFSYAFRSCQTLPEVTFGAFSSKLILIDVFGGANTYCIKRVANEADKEKARQAGWTNVQIINATNIEKVSSADGLFLSTSTDGKMIIKSPIARTVSIFGIDGQKIDNVLLHEGINILNHLEGGIYIIEGMKVIL